MNPRSSQRGRFFGLGLLLALVVMLIAVPRLLRGGDHPLAQTSNFDLCEKLGDEVWSVLGSAVQKPGVADALGALAGGRALPEKPRPQSEPGDLPACRFGDVSAFVVTTASLRRQGSPGSSVSRYAETFVEETRASGWSDEAIPGPWQDGHLLRAPRSDPSLQVLATDGGIFLSVTARGVNAADLTRFAAAAARKLRE